MSAVENDVVRAVAALALADAPVLTPETAMTVFNTARKESRPILEVLLEHIDETSLLAGIAAELGMPFVDLYAADSAYVSDPSLLEGLDAAILRENTLLPLRAPDGSVVAAMSNPFVNRDAVAYLRDRFPRVITALAPGDQVQTRLVQLSTVDWTSSTAAGDDDGAQVVEWTDHLFERSHADGASDVSFLFNDDGSLLVRFRIDSTWRPQVVPAALRGRENEIVGSVLNRCSTVDPSDRRRPQDGTFSFALGTGKRIDARLSMMPQVNGPTIVIRLLDPDNVRRRLDDMGFASHTLQVMRESVAKPQGLVLMVGPTGSGKTTTLYGLLNELDATSLNILTVEDPVEYRMPNIGQTQIRGDLGERSLTFAKALRGFLRLAPDVILVGEIRDRETAEVASHAALTGHLVLSTLHTNSALGVVPRLVELGVEPFLLAESLRLAASQRLLRRLHTCKVERAPLPEEVAFLQRQGLEVPDRVAGPTPTGCAGCGGTGYRGRVPVVETFAPNPTTSSLIAQDRPLEELRSAAKDTGYSSILQDGHRHVLDLSTAVSELLRCLDTGGA